ncbi:S-layer homology domain-containing protein [Paenibacillus ehimensis]|uniref:S-layer homology domain-containing protein n=1 Tax=Paenibacillus ehimensis TaxID=79264 RepID=UPI002DB89CB8|nr:S-layer homology domain-containing protein [Paenibacillus ehimensis]MEC0213431.1 S-layer homology domain-containing protein [Paenibacillus ehimensis]
MKKSVVSFFLAVLLSVSLLGVAYAETQTTESKMISFTDISGHWAEAAINKAVKAGYVGGYPDGTFKPDQEVSRAEFTKMLTTALGLKSVSSTSGAWYQEAVNAATEAGIYADDFKSGTWDTKMPRKEMMLLSVRAGITGYKQDYDMNRNLYEGAKAGLIMGTSPGNIDPDGTTTRAQAVVVIERVLAVKRGETLPSDKYAVGAAEILWHKTNILTMLPQYFGNPMRKANNEYIEFRDDLMQSVSDNGKIACSVTKLVAVDLDDPNDPNRGLVTSDDFRWYSNNQIYKLKGASGSYAVFTTVDIKFSENHGTNFVTPCSTTIYNSDWQNAKLNATDTSNLNRDYAFFPWDSEYNSFMYGIRTDIKSGTITYTRGQLIPKQHKVSNKEFVVEFSGNLRNEGVKQIYSSTLK